MTESKDPPTHPRTSSINDRQLGGLVAPRALFVNGEIELAIEVQGEAIRRAERLPGSANLLARYRERLDEYLRAPR